MTPTRVPSDAEIAAVDAIMTAYMACNAAGHPLDWERGPAWSPNPTAMGYLADAGRAAWTELDLPSDLWNGMIACGEGAAWVLACHMDGLANDDAVNAALRAEDDDPL